MASTSSLEYFKSNFLKKGLAKPSRYEIEFEGPGKTNLSMPAETVTLPSRSFVTVMEQWYGPERQIPVGNKFDSSVIITFPVSTDQSERTFFEEWMNTIVDPAVEQGNYGKILSSSHNMNIQTLDEFGTPTSKYELKEVYPSNIFPISLGAGMFNDYTRIQVQFEYRNYIYTLTT